MLDSSAESLVLALAALDVGLALALVSALAPMYTNPMLTVATPSVPSKGMEGGMYREKIEAEETKIDDISLLFGERISDGLCTRNCKPFLAKALNSSPRSSQLTRGDLDTNRGVYQLGCILLYIGC